MKTADKGHPSDAELNDYGAGRLDDFIMDRLEHHLASCDACCEKLRRLEDDPLVRLARQAQQTRVYPVESTPGVGGKPVARPPSEVPPALRDHPRYRIVRRVGVGGMGEVFLAEHKVMERKVALKIIHRQHLKQPQVLDRFRREVKTAAQLDHPNIVRAFDAEEAGGVHFLVLEYVEGQSLARLVEEKGPLPFAQSCRYVAQVAQGLHYAARKNMVHRDIKPQNLMITPRGQIKILDFGLVRFAVEKPGDLTDEQTVVGTPDYLAPEQARNSRLADIRSDLYSLGCTWWFLLTGAPPFPEGTSVEKLLSHHQATPQPLAKARPDLPREGILLVEKLLAKAPADRFQTPAELLEALRPWLDGDTPATNSPVRTPSRRAIFFAAMGLILACLVPLVWWLVTRPSNNALVAAKPRVLMVLPQTGLWWNDYGPVRETLESEGCIVKVASSGLKTCAIDPLSDGEDVKPDFVLDASISAKDWDAVVFVGKRTDEFQGKGVAAGHVAKLLKGMTSAKKPVTAICMGQDVLLWQGMLKGREVAANPHNPEQALRFPSQGVAVLPETVVLSANILTGGTPQDARPFALRLSKMLHAGERGTSFP